MCTAATFKDYRTDEESQAQLSFAWAVRKSPNFSDRWDPHGVDIYHLSCGSVIHLYSGETPLNESICN